MRSTDVQDELAEGFEVSELPPIGPDGAPQLSPLRTPTDQPPRLCEAGPCRHYHRMTIRMDAADPLPQRGADGALRSSPSNFHVEQHHYCYPDVGIEAKLGRLPVLECNRWSPISARDERAVAENRGAFMESAAGVAYQAEMKAWQARRAAELAAEQSADELAAADLALMPKAEATTASHPSGPLLTIRARVEALVVEASVQATWTETIGAVVATGINILVARRLIERTEVKDHDCYLRVPGAPWKQLDPNALISHIGLLDGDAIELLNEKSHLP